VLAELNIYFHCNVQKHSLSSLVSQFFYTGMQITAGSTRSLDTANRSGVRRGVTGPAARVGGWQTVKTLFSPSLITTQNLVAPCHTMWAYVGWSEKKLKRWGPAPWVRAWLVTMPTLVAVDQYERVRGDPPQKFIPSGPAFQGRSRSFKVARFDWVPMNSDYWSIVTMGLSRTVSEIIGNICWKP